VSSALTSARKVDAASDADDRMRYTWAMSAISTSKRSIEVAIGSMEAAARVEPKPRNQPYKPYRGTLLSPQRVRELSMLRPWRAIRDTAWCWAWIVAAWTLVALYPTWWSVLLAIPVIGSRYYALFIIGHDGMHGRVLNNKKQSDLFTDVFLLGPIGAVVHLNAKNHLIHHKTLANDDDPDLPKHGCFNKSDHVELITFLTGLGGVWLTIKNVFLSSLKTPQPSRSNAASSPPTASTASDAGDAEPSIERGGYTLRDAVVLLGWQALLVGGLTTAIGYGRGGRTLLDIAALGWWAFPVLWLMPVYIFTYLTNLIRAFLEHAHPEDDDVADHHRLTTFLSNPIERLLLAPMNMNYHIAHHLWPSIPYYNLSVADREIRNKPGSEGLTWRGSYLACLWEYWRAEPIAECKTSRHRRMFMGH
jgi:fatty acid desaturase